MKTDEKKPEAPDMRSIPIDQLVPSPNNPRKTWSQDKDETGHTSLHRLAESIREEGVLQPLIVTPQNGHFRIVCGERRYRAAKEHTDLKVLPCIVRTDLDERSALEVSLTENLQREDLSPMDTAHACHELIEKCGYTARAIAQKLGVSPAAISQRLSLLKLSPELQADVHQGKLTESQGTAIAHAVSKHPLEKRAAALKDIKQRVDKARTKKARLDTKDVKTIARTQKKPKAKLTPATPKERKSVRAFFAALDHLRGQLKDFEPALADTSARRRLAELLVHEHEDVVNRIQKSCVVLTRVFNEVSSVVRECDVA